MPGTPHHFAPAPSRRPSLELVKVTFVRFEKCMVSSTLASEPSPVRGHSRMYFCALIVVEANSSVPSIWMRTDRRSLAMMPPIR